MSKQMYTLLALDPYDVVPGIHLHLQIQRIVKSFQ